MTRLDEKRVPYGRWCSFGVYSNPDRSSHILVTDDSGGYIVVERIEDRLVADWICGLLNAAIGAKDEQQSEEG